VKSDRFLELDALRGVAIFSVLLFHFTTRYNQIYGHTNPTFQFPIGRYGVYLFFIISGFVTIMALERIEKPLDFIIFRFSRLYPAYWFAVLLTFSIVGIFSLPGREVSISDAIINLSMFQKWFNVPYVDGTYWALSIFLSFYIIMLIFYKLKLIKHIELVSIIWLLLILSRLLLERFLGFKIPGVIKLSLLLDFGNLFIMGITFYLIKTKGGNLFRHMIIGCCLLVQWPLSSKSAFMVSCFSVLFFYFFIQKYLCFIALKPLIFIGNISYSLYIIHQNIGYVIIRNLYNYNLNYFMIILVPTLISLFLASLITFYIERPASIIIRHFYKHRHLSG
jgi:peptidoglycan/LPS O-acetylase OafA/YrhL